MDNFEELWERAHQAGMVAGNSRTPKPMVVQQHLNPFNTQSPITQSWPVNEGVCGFAWINIRPGNSAFARWIKATGRGRPDSYEGGVRIWVKDFGQSYERKLAYADAVALVLNDAGIRAVALSRLD